MFYTQESLLEFSRHLRMKEENGKSITSGIEIGVELISTLKRGEAKPITMNYAAVETPRI